MASVLLATLPSASACGAGRTPRAVDAGASASAPAGSPSVHPAAVAACDAAQVAVGAPSVGGAMGTVYYLYPIHLRRGPACTVRGIPTVTPLAGGVRAPIRVVDTRDATAGGSWDYRRPVRLDRRAHDATLRMAWSDDWCTTPLVVDRLRLRVGDGTVDAPGPGRSPGCYGRAGDPPPPVRVWPVYPAGLRP